MIDQESLPNLTQVPSLLIFFGGCIIFLGLAIAVFPSRQKSEI